MDYLVGLLVILWLRIDRATSIRWSVVPMCMLVEIEFWPCPDQMAFLCAAYRMS